MTAAVLACSSSCATYVALGLGIGAVMVATIFGGGVAVGAWLMARGLDSSQPTKGDS